MNNADTLYAVATDIAMNQNDTTNEANVLDKALRAAMKHLNDNPQALYEIALAVEQASENFDELEADMDTESMDSFKSFLTQPEPTN